MKAVDEWENWLKTPTPHRTKASGFVSVVHLVTPGRSLLELCDADLSLQCFFSLVSGNDFPSPMVSPIWPINKRYVYYNCNLFKIAHASYAPLPTGSILNTENHIGHSLSPRSWQQPRTHYACYQYLRFHEKFTHHYGSGWSTRLGNTLELAGIDSHLIQIVCDEKKDFDSRAWLGEWLGEPWTHGPLE